MKLIIKKTTTLTTYKENRKMTQTQIPPRGMGTKLYRAYSNLLLLIGYNASAEMLFGPCYLGSKGLQNTRKISPAKGKASWELQMSKKAIFRQSFLLFFDGPTKKYQANVIERCPNTLWKCLWTIYKNYKKNLSNN